MARNAISIVTARPTELDFDLTVEGIEPRDARAWFCINTDQYTLSFECEKAKEDENSWLVHIPTLPYLQKGSYPFFIEVVIDGYYFNALNGTAQISGDFEVSAENLRKLTPGKPEPKTRKKLSAQTKKPSPPKKETVKEAPEEEEKKPISTEKVEEKPTKEPEKKPVQETKKEEHKTGSPKVPRKRPHKRTVARKPKDQELVKEVVEENGKSIDEIAQKIVDERKKDSSKANISKEDAIKNILAEARQKREEEHQRRIEETRKEEIRKRREREKQAREAAAKERAVKNILGSSKKKED